MILYLAASSKKIYSRRLIFSTASEATHHLTQALKDQNPPVTIITESDLIGSVIDWTQYIKTGSVTLKPKYSLRDHQQIALDQVIAGFKIADRGKLIMACGTGKTFTSLKIAEQQAGQGKQVLFLVPSLALLSKSLTEWTQQSAIPLHCFAVCSDSQIGKHKGEDTFQTYTYELSYPATTNGKQLAKQVTKNHDSQHMTVVFSTYQSIEVIHQAQQSYQLAPFDLIICDEAHRTTGATLIGEQESHFVKIHQPDFIQGKKRLYMTATPRIYGDSAKTKAEQESVTLLHG
ncbi:DEAD/DEAH box helicase family protein [Candidatus Nitrosacidococcus sp. I8]|uniref:DEAD/DEAH box helicase family protein n=1 Tax=Candidatus Nitrosacidococcus sp. I8 TaxID=2942908 RepID=UPI002227C6E1|nr:DEAD/DEAH box helicase family protein [Candidatus Nitrosacidococcus sp. I8]CAH9018593.1 hypothetical protein NURINAE_01015 [Candidatus Nitrosacidococcus sp. I8]